MSIEDLEAWHFRFEREHPEWTVGQSDYPTQAAERERLFKQEMKKIEREKLERALAAERENRRTFLMSHDAEAVRLIKNARSVLTKRSGSAVHAAEIVQGWVNAGRTDQFRLLDKYEE